MELLRLGLKFTPTPRANQEELVKDTREFTRKLRLGEFFLDRDGNDDGSIVKNKSQFMPPRGRNHHLDKYIDFLHATSATQAPQNQKKSNTPHYLQHALKELQDNHDLIIKEADKGGAIVLMDKDYYEEKIMEMLADKETYKEIPNNIDRKTLAKIAALTNKYDAHLTEKEKDYLVNFENKNSLFYGLPKIHKSGEIIQAVKTQNQPYIKIRRPADLKFRPIVAGPSCPTHRLSNMIDILLKPLLVHTRSYTRDDIDFLTKLPTQIKDCETFATFDISSLYSNITHELGLQAVEYWLHKHPETLISRIPSKFISESLKIILENNSFSFGTKNYIQIQGTAMGTKMAPTYANLTLAFLEETLYDNMREKYTAEFAGHFERHWKRYIDDCFIIWDNSLDKVETLHAELNNLHPKLHFTMEQNKSEISFLDIHLTRQNQDIVTDIFHKPTDTKQYLHFKSCHPRSTKCNIPYNLARRICTIVTHPHLRTVRLQEMKSDLLKRGYPPQLIDRGIEKATSLSIETLRTPKPVTETNPCAFVYTHNPRNRNMWTTVQNSLDVLHSNPRCSRVLNSFVLINSRRQPPNLKKLLTKARLDTATPTVTQCLDKRCGTCPYLITGEHFTFKGSQKPFRVKVSMNCATENLLYVLQCQGCSENYIGQTSDSLRARIRVHKQQINTPEYRKIAVSKHIAECAGDCSIPFKVFPFYKLFLQDKTLRDVKEQSFIRTFKPFLNSLTYL
jgi:hypothetical protein